MASNPIEALGQEIARITSSYDTNFAGQQRASRNLAELDALIGRLGEVLKQLERLPYGPPGSDQGKLIAEAKARLADYTTERSAIAAAKNATPELTEFSQLAVFANFVFARYYRHFAGKDRGTRDVGLLKEMVEELRTIRQRMSVVLIVDQNPSFQRDAELVSQMIERYQDEVREIEKAYVSGTAEDQASRLADLANAQIDIYRQHFVDKARLTRRPALLQRVIENLRRIRSSMQNLRLSGKAAENNRGNLNIVDSNLKFNESELMEIRKIRQSAPISDILGMLGGAANEVFDEYRKNYSGQDRRKVQLEPLGVMCDKLGEVARQMLELGRTEKSEMNERNLEIVIEQLSSYEQEYKEIIKAQGLAQGTGQSAPSRK